MSDLQITIDLPEELVERAHAVGLSLESQTDKVIELLEDQIKKAEARQRLRDTMAEIDQLPDELKPTFDYIAEALHSLPPELKPSEAEIQAEIRVYWDEQAAQ